MLANLADVDEAMIQRAAEGQGAYAIFFDFAAAFPSVEHALFREFFKSLGWPAWLRNFVGSLYRNNHCFINLGGSRHAGFDITRGIRQGCPLSPLLFAAASDLFLRRLARMFPDATLRAWADDLAMVLPMGANRLSKLQAFFDEFALVSGLQLNLPKTVIIPLDPFNEPAVRAEVAQGAPG